MKIKESEPRVLAWLVRTLGSDDAWECGWVPADQLLIKDLHHEYKRAPWLDEPEEE